jgi:hypothetical protein
MHIRRLGAALFAAAILTAVAGPVAIASADEPIECKIVNGIGKKYLGGPVMYCIDDPNGPGDPL